MSFVVHASRRALKSLEGFPSRDRLRLMAAIDAMAENPLAGDVVKLKGTDALRRRVGSYRIIFTIDFEQRIVSVIDILRRTTTTYR
jgi:mRNA interferase RelE/StbE